MPYKNKKDQSDYSKKRRESERHKKYIAKWREENKEKISEYNKEWRKKNKDKRKKYIIENKIKIQGYCKTEKYKKRKKDYYLKRDFDITLEDYNKLFAEQEGKCPICNKHQSELKIMLSVDHNHKTGEIRNLLCSNCNFLLGMANDNIEILKNAIKYLEKHNE